MKLSTAAVLIFISGTGAWAWNEYVHHEMCADFCAEHGPQQRPQPRPADLVTHVFHQDEIIDCNVEPGPVCDIPEIPRSVTDPSVFKALLMGTGEKV